jgi:hypothetical protein
LICDGIQDFKDVWILRRCAEDFEAGVQLVLVPCIGKEIANRPQRLTEHQSVTQMNWVAREAHEIERLELFGPAVARALMSSGSPL